MSYYPYSWATTDSDWEGIFYGRIRAELEERDYWRGPEGQRQLREYEQWEKAREEANRKEAIEKIKNDIPSVGRKLKIIWFDGESVELEGRVTRVDDRCRIYGTWGDLPLNPYYDNWIDLNRYYQCPWNEMPCHKEDCELMYRYDIWKD